MKLFASQQKRDIDEYCIINTPITSIDLMERAATELFYSIGAKNYFSKKNKFIIICGQGNNGGDGLALSRIFAENNYDVSCVFCNFSPNMSQECEINLQKVNKNNKLKFYSIENASQLPKFDDRVIVDCIFGTGLSRKVEGEYAKVISEINKSGNEVISVDIPSGLFGEDNSENDGVIVCADQTFCIGHLPISSMFAENEKYYGEISLIDIGLLKEIEENIDSNYYLLDKYFIKSLIKRRKKFSHKGDYGHALLIAGSYGKAGAAVLAAKACMRAGAGLLTVHLPKNLVGIMQTSLPEAMISADINESYFSEIRDFEKFSAIGIGPGLGLENSSIIEFTKFLKINSKPLVIDADGLNILSKNKKLIKYLKPGSILTPHPKEFERLFGKFSSTLKEIEFMREFSHKTGIIIVRKSAVTAISTQNGIIYFNDFGNPGMATAGAGDVLTGIITSLLAQGYSSEDSAILGVALHAKAGDLYLENNSTESLIASDIIEYLGKAFYFFKDIF